MTWRRKVERSSTIKQDKSCFKKPHSEDGKDSTGVQGLGGGQHRAHEIIL
jgi:hypothetical protein